MQRPARLALPLLALALLLAAAAHAQQPFDRGGTVEYTVLLEAPSVGERYRADTKESKSGPVRRSAASDALMRRAVVRAQDPVIAAIEAQGVEVAGSVQSVLNAVFVWATAEQADAISQLDGVRAVVPGQRYEPTLSYASDIVRVSAARQRPGETALLGEGMKIAIVDSGLDFDHEAFHDTTLAPLAGYPRADYRSYRHANSKVIAVRSYVDMLNSRRVSNSTPDDNSPWDSSGHGTAVAMIAAGKEVSTPAGLVSGIAPKARIGVYKVFGTPNLNYYTNDGAVIRALDDAVKDGMDIVNLSLGRPSYYPWDSKGSDCGYAAANADCNPLAVAAQSLVEDLGIVVVAAAGNHGGIGWLPAPARTTIYAPAVAPAVVAVGSTGNSASIVESVQIGGRSFKSRSGTGPAATENLTAQAVLVSSIGDTRACSAFPDHSLAGKIAVIDRGVCFFVQKVEHADAAGALGVLVINHQGDRLVTMALLEDTDIPAFFVGGSDGAAIRELMQQPGSALTLNPTPVASDEEWTYVNYNSSRGPSLALLPKPDLVAPGTDVYTAAPRYNPQGTLYTPSGYRTLSGTSFAAPVAAGAAALVWQAYPSFSPRQVASALINSARPVVMENDEPARLSSAGAGVLDIEGALRPNATVVPPTIGFGSVASARFPVRRTIQVANKHDRQQTYVLTVEPRDVDGSARVTVNSGSSARFTLRPGQSRTVRVALEGTRPAPGSYEGRLRLASQGGHGDLTIPYLYVVGENDAADAVVFRGRNEIGIQGRRATETVAARVLDRNGIPVVGQEVTFAAVQESVNIQRTTTQTGPTGLIFATVEYGPDPGDQQVGARIGNLELLFTYNAADVKPSISSVNNSATGASPDGVAAGSLVKIRGDHFALHPSGTPDVPQARRLPISRKGATVAFDAVGTSASVAGRIVSIGPDVVTVQLPWEFARATSGWVKVRAGKESEPFRFPVVETDPGIFSYRSGAYAYPHAWLGDGTSVSDTNRAPRGEVISVSMTGNGPVQSPPQTGLPGTMLNSTLHTPVVRVGGVQAEVKYSGLDPVMAGLYLVTFAVPRSITPGFHRVTVEINDVTSNEVLLPVR